MTILQLNFSGSQVLSDLTYSEFFWTLYAPVGAWLLFVIILFIVVLRKYTFGNWTADSPNPYEGETLGLPRGFFRGILTVTLLFVTVLLELTNVRLGNDESNIREFLVAFQMMIAFYFGAKVMHHITSVDRQKASFVYRNNYDRYDSYNRGDNMEDEMRQRYQNQDSMRQQDDYEDEAVG